jgi:hypothetical protein
MEGNVEDQY